MLKIRFIQEIYIRGISLRYNFIIILTILFSHVFANSWEDIIPNFKEKDYKEIEKDGYTDRNRVDYRNGLELFPIGNDFEDEFYDDLKLFNPELVTEMLYVIDMPDIKPEDMTLYLLNNLRAFSDQKGLEYWSHNRGKMHPLILESNYVEEIKGDVIDDPIAAEIPVYEEHVYYQDDSSFGGNYYNLITRTKNNSIWLQMTNINKLKVFKLFNAIGPEEQRTNFIIYPYNDKLIIYCQAQIMKEPKVKRVLTYKVNIPGSFKRRMDTIIKWFIRRIS